MGWGRGMRRGGGLSLRSLLLLLTRFALLLELANAEDGFEPRVEYLERLLVHVGVRIAEDGAALRVPSQHVIAADRVEHRRGHGGCTGGKGAKG